MPSYVRVGPEITINTTYVRSQAHVDTNRLANGNIIAVWIDADFNTSAGRFLRAQIFDPQGQPVGVELTLVASSSVGIQPTVVGLANGGFAVSWISLGSVRAQVFDGSGVAVSSVLDVSPVGASTIGRPDIAALANGSFVISWNDNRTSGGDTTGAGVHARTYSATGVSIGGDVLVNIATAGNQADSAVTALAGGGYVITWTDRGNAAGWVIKAQIFDSAGVRAGSEFIVNMLTGGFVSSVQSTVTTLANGNFAVAWFEGTLHRVQVFSANGTAVGSQITTASNFAGTQVGPSIAALADGGLAIAWTANTTLMNDGSDSGIFVQFYDAQMQPVGSPMQANTQANGSQFEPSIVALANGGVMVTWNDLNGAGADDDQVRGQIFMIGSEVAITSNGGGNAAAVAMAENSTAVTQIAATSSQSGATIVYSIVGGADAGLFVIDAQTGALSFLTSPDFESPADAGSNGVYDVTVRATDGTSSDTQDVAITIVDANEAPEIVSGGGGGAAAYAVDEGATAVATISASDPDNNPRSYSIVGGADAALFAIDVATGALAFVNAPDHEAPADADGNNVYEIIVQASDGSLSDTQTISVTIGNVNEAPVITSNGAGEAAVVAAGENSIAVTIVTATDVDGSAISFAISGGADAALFAIDPLTGVLSFVQPADFEAPGDADLDNIYDVIVTASDGTLIDTQSLAISVANINEAPVIISNGGGENAALSVQENTGAVTTVSAGDVDGPAISYAIAGGADAALFVIDPVTGVLSFVAAPDFEAPGDADLDNVYDVLVSASDGVLIDIQSLLVTVADVNEAPEIVSGGGGAAAVYTIDEGAGYIDTIAATDPEGNPRTYAIVGGADAARFAIDAVTGALAFVGTTDFEAPTDADGNNVYEVIVEASDGTLVDTQSLSVTISNVNETPVITSNGGGATAAVTVNENAVAVANVASIDPDGNPLSYSIVGGADAARFAVHATTGALSFVNAPNFEAPGDTDGNNVYDVVVQASDGTLFDTQAIAVTVANINEGPVITSNGGGATAVIQTNENNRLLPSVQATDAEGSAISYSIVGGADAARFTLNTTSGQLLFAASPNYEAPVDVGANNVYDIVVQASDGVNVTTQTLSIVVNNLTDGVMINGGNGNNALTGTNAEDTIDGLGGNDIITGGLGADRLFGGTGADRFVYNSISDSPMGSTYNPVSGATVSNMDSIRDFSRSQGDRISLSAIDADANVSGNQAFAFIGNAAFSNVAGQLRYSQVNGNTIVSGDVNGDGVADFAIELTGIVNLQSGDFIL